MAQEKGLFTGINSKTAFLNFYLNTANQNIKCIFAKDTYESALTSIQKLNSFQEKKFIRLLRYVDNNMNFSFQANKNYFHKVATLLSSAIYLNKYYAKVKDYTNAELSLLSKFSSIEKLAFYENWSLFGTKELLETITSKTKDYFYQEDIFLLVEKLYNQQYNHQSIINYIKEHNVKDLIIESIMYDEERVKECEKNASRRFRL